MPSSSLFAFNNKGRMKILLCTVASLVAISRTPTSDGFSTNIRRGVQNTPVPRRSSFVLPSPRLSASDTSNGDKKEPLTPEKIAAMIEVSFIEGCMQLAQGYVDTLKLFIAAVLTAYGVTLPVNRLIDLVQECPTQSANRPLMQEEEDLRTTWIKLVYLTAHDVQYRQAIVRDAEIWTNRDEDDKLTICKAMLPRLRKRHAEGNETGPRFQAQEIMSENMDILGDATKDPMQKALLLQNLRVIWMVLTVMEEEKLAANRDPPAPPIPNKL
eukprot:scaffold2782_cov182-Amphora_coffeaeformis.AAC.29